MERSEIVDVDGLSVRVWQDEKGEWFAEACNSLILNARTRAESALEALTDFLTQYEQSLVRIRSGERGAAARQALADRERSGEAFAGLPLVCDTSPEVLEHLHALPPEAIPFYYAGAWGVPLEAALQIAQALRADASLPARMRMVEQQADANIQLRMQTANSAGPLAKRGRPRGKYGTERHAKLAMALWVAHEKGMNWLTAASRVHRRASAHGEHPPTVGQINNLHKDQGLMKDAALSATLTLGETGLRRLPMIKTRYKRLRGRSAAQHRRMRNTRTRQPI